MNDQDLITELSRQWRQGTDSPANIVHAALRQKRVNRFITGAEMAAAALAVVTAVYFWRQGTEPIYLFSGVVLFFAGIIGGALAFRLRRPLARWSDWTVSGVLEFRIQACRVAIRNAQYGMISACVLLIFALLVVFVEWNPDAAPEGFRHLYGAITIPVAFLIGAWSLRRGRQKRGELQRLRQLLIEFQQDG